MANIKFLTYSWAYGTTSFRVSELKFKIERQLLKLKQLFDENSNNYNWQELQENYFEMLLDEDWFQSSSIDSAKYARQVSSSLKDLGLIFKDRQLTDVGKELSRILIHKDFNFNNILGIRNDSFLYLKQFLKIEFSNNSNSRSYSQFRINPFLGVIYFINELGYIKKDELTYILPLIKNYSELARIVGKLKSNRNYNLYEIIVEKIKDMENYQQALEYFLQNPADIRTFEIILLDRKSKKSTSDYLNLFLSLQTNNVKQILNSIQKIPQKQKGKYYKFLFNTDSAPSKKNIDKAEKYFLSQDFGSHIKENFFYLVHFAKWTTNLEEYFDLNKRFLDLTDIFIFEDNIQLTPIASIYFQEMHPNLLKIELSKTEKDYINALTSLVDIDVISPKLKVSDSIVFNKLKSLYPSLVGGNLKDSVDTIIKHEKTIKFNHLIDAYFSVDTIQDLLQNIKKREDSKIKNYIHWDCDIPTVFEYLIGIVWYLLNDKKDDISKFLNMTLDANLLPRRFAGGGKSDLIFEYENHSTLIEVTLSFKDNQKRMELEPVSRHLGRHKLSTKNNNDFAIFIAPYLDANVLVHFRSYKNLRYYDTNNTSNFIEGLKIIPLTIDDVCQILKKNYNKESLEKILDDCFLSSEEDGLAWYENQLHPKL